MDHVLVPMKLMQLMQLRRIMSEVAEAATSGAHSEAIRGQISSLKSMSDDEIKGLHFALSKLG